jgi:hypothetical protein
MGPATDAFSKRYWHLCAVRILLGHDPMVSNLDSPAGILESCPLSEAKACVSCRRLSGPSNRSERLCLRGAQCRYMAPYTFSTVCRERMQPLPRCSSDWGSNYPHVSDTLCKARGKNTPRSAKEAWKPASSQQRSYGERQTREPTRCDATTRDVSLDHQYR